MRHTFLLFVRGYRIISPSFAWLSMLFGYPGHCRYPITCSEFAMSELEGSTNLAQSVKKIILRVLSCGPWGRI